MELCGARRVGRGLDGAQCLYLFLGVVALSHAFAGRDVPSHPTCSRCTQTPPFLMVCGLLECDLPVLQKWVVERTMPRNLLERGDMDVVEWRLFSSEVYACPLEFRLALGQLQELMKSKHPLCSLPTTRGDVWFSVDYYCQVHLAMARRMHMFGDAADGTLDFAELVEDSSGGLLDDVGDAENAKLGALWSWLAKFETLTNRLKSQEHKLLDPRLYGNADISRLFVQHHLLKDRPPEYTLAFVEQEIWEDLYMMNDGDTWSLCADKKEDACGCAAVSCEIVTKGGKTFRHITSIVTTLLSHKITDIPAHFMELQYLRGLYMTGGSAVTLGDNILQLPRLEVLEAPVVALPLEWGSQPDSLLKLDIALTPQVWYGNSSRGLEALCSLRSLRVLSIHGSIEPMPECFGELRQLVRLRFTGNFPHSVLPSSIGMLTNLKVFMAFYNAEYECPHGLLDPQQNLCRTKSVVFEELDEHRYPVVCEPGSLSGTIPDAWRGLVNIEKMWIDGNWLSGTIPAWIGHAWTKLRRLDLRKC